MTDTVTDQSVVEVAIITAHNAHDLEEQARAGDTDATEVMQVLDSYYEDEVTGGKHYCCGCLGAGAVLGALAVAMTFTERKRRIFVAPICVRCSTSGEDLQQIALRSLGGRPLTHGQA